MSKKSQINKSFFIYNFVFFLGLNVVINFLVRYISKHSLLPANPVIQFSFVHNYGAAFSILDSKIPILIAISVIALAYIVYRIYISKKALDKCAVFGFAALAAGITHNLYERIQFGYVLDYFDLKFINFAVFNTADVFITIGAIILIYLILVKNL